MGGVLTRHLEGTPVLGEQRVVLAGEAVAHFANLEAGPDAADETRPGPHQELQRGRVRVHRCRPCGGLPPPVPAASACYATGAWQAVAQRGSSEAVSRCHGGGPKAFSRPGRLARDGAVGGKQPHGQDRVGVQRRVRAQALVQRAAGGRARQTLGTTCPPCGAVREGLWGVAQPALTAQEISPFPACVTR